MHFKADNKFFLSIKIDLGFDLANEYLLFLSIAFFYFLLNLLIYSQVVYSCDNAYIAKLGDCVLASFAIELVALWK